MPELTPSTREAARRIGVTETALRKAATNGRIEREPDGQWDVEKTRRRIGRSLERDRKIELDQVAIERCREQAAARLKSRRLIRIEQLFGPERVSAGQRRVTAQIDLHRRSEPAQRPVISAMQQEGGLGEVHLRTHLLHPCRFALAVEQNDRRGISLERPNRERVDVENPHRT